MTSYMRKLACDKRMLCVIYLAMKKTFIRLFTDTNRFELLNYGFTMCDKEVSQPLFALFNDYDGNFLALKLSKRHSLQILILISNDTNMAHSIETNMLWLETTWLSHLSLYYIYEKWLCALRWYYRKHRNSFRQMNLHFHKCFSFFYLKKPSRINWKKPNRFVIRSILLFPFRFVFCIMLLSERT